ncbi:hypothetical protein J6590_031698 [Homalodisca vitripennis]|nr:hypothetical protein J6590_031698 [Homalodisca vitripennis]
MNSSIMANVKKAFTGEVKDLVDPYVQVSFAGLTGKTSVRKHSYAPVWNEQIVFTEMFPPLCQRIKVQLRDNDPVNNTVIGTHFIDLKTISNDGEKGFLPTFGPTFIHLYGSTRDYTLIDEHSNLNTGLGEGVSYRARLLVAIRTEITDNIDITPSQVDVEPTYPITETSYGKTEEFFLFSTILDASMIDKKLGDKPIFFELSIGNAGNTLDGHNETTQEPSDSDSDDNLEVVTSESISWQSTTSPIKPMTHDRTYYFLPYWDDKPCMHVRSLWPDYRRRMYNSNIINKIVEKLEEGLAEVQGLVEGEEGAAERQLRSVLEELSVGCARYSSITRGAGSGPGIGKTKLDKERMKLCQRDIEQIANRASLNNELNQLRKDNEFLNSRIIQLNKIAESVNSRFNNQVNDFKGLENTLKQQIVELKQQLSNLKGKSLDGQDGSVTAQGNDFTLCSTLLANGWIQDDLISLYFDLLLQSSIMKDAYFMKPCIGQAIKCAENVDVLLEHEIFNKSYVFIPINDSKAEMEVSGSHWSLMLYTKSENTFYYFDSMNNYNLGHARDVFTRLKSRMCSTGPSCFTEVSCPQQRNGSDCGVYVLLFVDRLIGMLLTRKDLVGFDFKECFGSSEINELDIIQKRSIMTYLIYKLQYKKLGEGIAKKLILCGKSDIKTDLPKINTYETHANVERQENKPNEEHVKILEEELNKSKNENENRQSVVEILHSDKKQLQDKINKAESVGQHCLKCSLPLVNKTAEHSPNQNKGRVKTRDQTVHVNKATKKSKSNLIILADSHGRDLGRLIEQKTTLNVCSFVKPGAKFSQVTKEVKDLTAELEPSDYLLVLAGTNNIQTTGIDTLMNDITKLVNDFQHINLILSTIPMRHDLPQLDLKISIINSKIEQLAENFPNLQLLPLHLLPRHVFTAHGLHFNMKGKARIADMVSKLKQMKGTSHNVPRQPKSQTHPFSIPSCKITVLETDINQLMDHFQNDQSVGFAHSISADFENTEKHMSAGIAVVFRKRFGRPKTSDLVNKHLAYQKVINDPSVYSLITKDKYSGKPTKQEYDAAFLKLQEDLERSQNTGVDLIQVSHFAKNIVEFQQVTGATVCIVSYEQPTAQRQLWRGLTHNEFVRTLRKQLAEHQAQKQQLDISPSSQSPLSGEVVVLSDVGLSVDTFASCLSLTDTPTLSQNISLTDSPTSSQNTFLTKTPTKLQNVSPTNTSSTNVTGNSVDLN